MSKYNQGEDDQKWTPAHLWDGYDQHDSSSTTSSGGGETGERNRVGGFRTRQSVPPSDRSSQGSHTHKESSKSRTNRRGRSKKSFLDGWYRW